MSSTFCIVLRKAAEKLIGETFDLARQRLKVVKQRLKEQQTNEKAPGK